jgi:hypothetical protein
MPTWDRIDNQRRLLHGGLPLEESELAHLVDEWSASEAVKAFDSDTQFAIEHVLEWRARERFDCDDDDDDDGDDDDDDGNEKESILPSLSLFEIAEKIFARIDIEKQKRKKPMTYARRIARDKNAKARQHRQRESKDD